MVTKPCVFTSILVARSYLMKTTRLTSALLIRCSHHMLMTLRARSYSSSHNSHLFQKCKNYSYTGETRLNGSAVQASVDASDGSIVYTDGACIGPGDNRQAGYGVYWGPGHRLNVSERLSGEQTNNRAEIEAVITAVKQAKEAGLTSITIATDSKFAQHCATEWGPVWEKNGWKLYDGKPVKLRKPVERLLRVIRESGVNVSWRYVPGHSGVEGNEAADRLANMGAKKPNSIS
ncbi:hypothetical protein CRM22_008236 [Opisthorchis felineus]|uniref:ribonuclease H n=1 Tax=Opisthorchis felineus TaxID=147828 RepID=A0A4S2LCE9_OPIFE|nr:hypothetical protein CRM22_008236 [Opisthorchis felineus]